jgi:hypothetical protein
VLAVTTGAAAADGADFFSSVRISAREASATQAAGEITPKPKSFAHR